MRKLFFLLLAGIALSLTSCRNDFAFEPSTGGLEFSKDTVYLDTVFTNIGSSTYTLKVYNRSNKDISIPKIQLGKGLNSKYRIMVDGMTGDAGAQGKIFSNVELLAKDSLFIFVEVTSDVASANPTDFLYTDQIQFSNVFGTAQTVELVTLIQDAIFIYPNRPISTGIKETLSLNGNSTNIEGHELSGTELTWTNNKPYVIYGYALVPNGATLNVQSGAKIHFHANSGLIIDKQGTLNINGELSDYDLEGNIITDREVRFQGDRLEPNFEDVPGQWGIILVMSENINTIKHLTLKNATVGIYTTPLDAINGFYPSKLNISNSQIYNCSNMGIYSKGAQINGENLVINNCGQYCLALTYGGTANFIHSTFNNNWNSSKQFAVLLTDNFEDFDNNIVYANNPTNIFNFTNCIIFGSNQVEYFIDKKGTSYPFLYSLKNCLIKFNNSQLNDTGLYNFNAISGSYNNCYISKNSTNFSPKFKNISKNELWPTEDLSIAPSLMTALPTSVSTDILGKVRQPTITVGAYQFIP